MKVYRYLDNEYGPKLHSLGLFGISTTSSVATIEGAQRDELDGHLVHRLDGHVTGHDPVAQARLRQHSIVIEPGGSATFYDTRVHHRIHGYMACFCRRPDSDAFPGKEWVFEIPNVHAFANALTTLAGGRLPPRCAVKDVSYTDELPDALDIRSPLVDPFRKAKIYEVEEEWRIFWQTPTPVERFSVFSHLLLQHFRLVRRPSQ